MQLSLSYIGYMLLERGHGNDQINGEACNEDGIEGSESDDQINGGSDGNKFLNRQHGNDIVRVATLVLRALLWRLVMTASLATLEATSDRVTLVMTF
jgi:hypothetical protein